jgi:DNA-binding transcriptional ArsR family regulator
MAESVVGERLVGLVGRRMQLLADPMRIRLIFALRGGEASVGQLADLVGRTPRVISHHLNALYREGILDRRGEGTTVFYCLADYSACKVLQLAGEGVNARIEELSDIAGERQPAQWFT